MRRVARIGETPKTCASEAAASASGRRTFQRLAFIYFSFDKLFPEPTVGVEQLDADASLAVKIVDPRSVYFGAQFTTGRGHECDSRSHRHIYVDNDRRAAVTDLRRRGLRLKSISGFVLTFNVQGKLDRNSGTAWPL